MGLDREVTRAEFTALVLRTLGVQAQNGASQDGYAVFDDVPFSYWAYGDIQMASDMGLINGVGGRMFSPQSPVTCQDALKIFVSALGFGEMAQAKGGYPYGYITMGRQAGLLEGVSTQAAEALNRDGVFCMVYNALNADNYQTVALGEGNISKELGKPLLKTNFNLDRYKNVLVSSVGQNGLGGAQDYADTEVVAGGVVFTSRTIDMAPYLGEKVTLFANEENEIVFVMPGEETKEITVAADRISDKTTTSKFVYENEDGKEVSLSLSGDLTVIYNQRNVAFPRAEDLKIKNGQVTLKSTTGKSTYDLVKVEAFETVYVKSIRIPILELTDYNGSVYRFANDEENTLEVYRGGAKAAFRDIQLQSVVSVYPSKTQANSYVKLQISTAKLTGTVNRVKKDEIGVGNNTYKLSQYFRQNGGVMPKVGDSITCRMNHLGEIVVIENAGRVSDSSYGYLLDWSNVKAFGANAKLKMFVSSGKETVYELSPEVKLNGKDATSSEILSLAAQNQYMPVRFKLDKEGKIKDIAFKEAGLTLAVVELQWPNQPKYNAGHPGFTASNGVVYKIGKDTFFMAAGIRNDVAMTNYWVDEDELYVMTPELRAKMVNGMVVDTLYAADPAADGTCGMIVMNPLKTVKPGIILDMSEFAPYSIFDTYTHSLFMVNGMTQGLNSEDEVVDMVEGLIDGEEKSFELAEYVAYEVLNQNPSAKPSRGYTDWTAETDFNGREPGLEPGDVIAVTFNMRGQIDNVLKICNAAAL